MASATRPVDNAAASDPLVETHVFWTRYSTHIIAAVAFVLLALAAYGGYRLYMARRDSAAAAMLANAKTPADYQKIISEHSGAPSAATAHLLLAEALRKEQKLAEANATLKAFTENYPKHELVTTAQMATAANLESLGKPDEALEHYRRIASAHPQSYNAPLALLAQARLLKQRRQIEDARRVCETVLAQYRDSFAAQEATRYLQTLKVRPAAPPPAAATAAPVPEATPSAIPVQAAPAAPASPTP